ncbi:hypothetical protein ACWJJH_00545 [Endozoicomonadaceae bacterium StTr2]
MMGVLWTTYPLNEEMREWLESEGVDVPENDSRFPTGKEVKEALESLESVNVEITDNGIGGTWQAWLNSSLEPETIWTLLNISEYSGDDEPQEVWFEKGDENLVKYVLGKISYKTGPQVLIPDTGDTPEVISA